MQISGAGEGGRLAGREPARPARAVAYEPFRPDDRDTARAARTPQRAATPRPGTETRSTEAPAGTALRDDRARQDRVQEDRAQDDRAHRDLVHRDRMRASDDAGDSAHRDAISGRNKIARDKSARDLTDHRNTVRDDARSAQAQAQARTPASGTTVPAGAAPAQAEAVRTAATAAGETDEAGDETEVEGEEADDAGTVPGSLLSLLAASVPSAAPVPGAASVPGAAAPSSAATGAVPAGPGDAAADPVQPALTGGDPRADALLAEAASRDAGRRDGLPEGGASPASDGLTGPGPSASAPPASGTDATPVSPAAADSRPPVSVPATLSAVPIAIGMRALAGSNRFEIRLDPYELGRIDVRLDIDRQHGTVKAHLVVERPETLALLQRDAGSLQQALSQAGLTPGEAGLSFSLQDHGGNAPRDQSAGRAPETGPAAAAGPGEAEPSLPPLRDLGQRLGLDLRI